MQNFYDIPENLIQRFDVRGPRYTSYPPVPVWSKAYSEQDFTQALVEAAQKTEDSMGLYIHLPFCKQRCSFCGCNVVVAKDSSRVDSYLDYVEKELSLVSGFLGARNKLEQLHLGGGTPTFLTTAQLRRLKQMINTRFEFVDNAECSVEVAPSVTTEEQIDCLAELGFNRISLGVQDFDKRVQEAIRREQSWEQTKSLIDRARKNGFSSVNIDLIYGLPLQTVQSWKETIEKVLLLEPDRLAVYGFAFLPQQLPHQKILEKFEYLNGLAKQELFLTCYQMLLNATYVPIGLDHFALPHDELAIAKNEGRLRRNFQGYTARSVKDTVGLGLTAISDIAGNYAQNHSKMNDYVAAVSENRLAKRLGYVRSKSDHCRGKVISDIMCQLETELGCDEVSSFDQELQKLSTPDYKDLVHISGRRIKLTPIGRLFARNIAMVFDSYMQSPVGGYSRVV